MGIGPQGREGSVARSADVAAYGEEALRRLLETFEVVSVNGSPVELRSATDLPPGHLDPWVARFDQSRDAERVSPGPLAALRGLAVTLFARDKFLLKGRAELDAVLRSEGFVRDLSSGSVLVTRAEWTLAGEARPVWKYERPAASAGPRPAFLHLHGGAFSAGTPTGRDPLLTLIADRSNAIVFDLDYSMIPEHTFPQAVLEAKAALTHLYKNAATWNIDPARLAIGGGSAGGNIAAATALMARDEGGPPVALQVLYSPFLSFGGLQKDLTFAPVHVVPEHRGLAGPQDFRVISLLMRLLYRSYRGKGHRRDPYMSPALAASFADLPPTLIITGEMDPLHQPAEHFGGDLAKAGVPVRAIRYRGCKHDTVSLVGHVPQAAAAALETISALESLARRS